MTSSNATNANSESANRQNKKTQDLAGGLRFRVSHILSLKFELVAYGQRACMAPAVAIVSEEVVNLVDFQQTDVVAKVDDDGHLELVGDTYGDGHVELIELVLAAGVGLYLSLATTGTVT